MGTVAFQITSLTIVYSTIDSDADQRKHQSSASLAFVRGVHRGPVNSLHKWPVTQKMFPFGDVIIMHWHSVLICFRLDDTLQASVKYIELYHRIMTKGVNFFKSYEFVEKSIIFWIVQEQFIFHVFTSSHDLLWCLTLKYLTISHSILKQCCLFSKNGPKLIDSYRILEITCLTVMLK